MCLLPERRTGVREGYSYVQEESEGFKEEMKKEEKAALTKARDRNAAMKRTENTEFLLGLNMYKGVRNNYTGVGDETATKYVTVTSTHGNSLLTVLSQKQRDYNHFMSAQIGNISEEKKENDRIQKLLSPKEDYPYLYEGL